MPSEKPPNPLDHYHHLNLSISIEDNKNSLIGACFERSNISKRRALNCMTANLITAIKKNKRIIGISHRPETYTCNRYNGAKVGYRALIQNVLPTLVEKRLLNKLTDGFGDRRIVSLEEVINTAPKNQRRVTRYEITNSLYQLLSKGPLNNARIIYEGGENLILKKNGRPFDYKDNDETNRMRSVVSLFNAFLDNQQIRHPHQNYDEAPNQYFVRIFNETFGLGGRFYRHWVMNLAKEERKQLLFNDESVCELDYRSMHPHLLYSECGINYHHIYKDNDPYFIEGFERGVIKSAFNVALNNKTRGGFGRALKHLLLKDDLLLPEEAFYGVPIRDALENKLHHIKKYFYSSIGFNWGMRCQYFDSCIMEKLIQELIKKDVCCIPMHDGIIVPRKHRLLTETLMKKVWISIRGISYPGVKLEY